MIAEALKALWEYRLRAILTLSILALGITALVGILTTLDALRGFIAHKLLGFGPHTFVVTGGDVRIQVGRKKMLSLKGRDLRLWEVNAFMERYSLAGAVLSRQVLVTYSGQAWYKGRKTPAQVRLFGVDVPYFSIHELQLAQGRFFTPVEVKQALPGVVIGSAVAQELFPHESPLGKWIRIGRGLYRVVGVLSPRGSLFGMNLDMECFIPWSIAYADAATPRVDVEVGAPSVEAVPTAMQEARKVMRQVRRLAPRQPEDFSLFRGEQIADLLLDQLRLVTLATIGISLITLLGATLSLANILLVAVKERTQEIGLRMALGATRRAIQQQFLGEALVIAVVGGGAGILLGLLLGNGVALYIGADFVMPWKWVLLATLLSGGVGLIAGYQPAREAARLEPVEALRYE